MKPDLQVRSSDLMWIGLAFLVLIFAGFGLRDPWPADEPRFAGVAFDMVRSGYWLIPHAGGDLYQDKPPLHFWMIAASYVVTGSTRAAFLLPSMLASLGTLLLVYDLGRRLHGREAGLAAALTLACCVQFVQVTRGAQIDATLIFFITLSVWALSRHLLSGPHLGLALLGGIAAGLGVVDKAVGFLALLLLPIAWLLRRRDAAAVAAGALRPAAVLTVLAGFFVVIAAWLLPMLWHVQQVGTPELAAYRDELLFQQTVKRYTDAWHHIRPPYYYLVEVIPALWLPLSALLFWLWRPWREDWRARRAATLLPLGFAIAVVLFFSLSTGKRGVYVLPALPALALAAAPHLAALYRRIGVGRLSLGLGAVLLIPAWAIVVGSVLGLPKASALLDDTPLDSLVPLWAFAIVGLAAWLLAARLRPVFAWPAVLGCLTLAWGFGVAPQLNPERSASGFVAQLLERAPRDRELGLLAYKEQFLLYLDREVVNFGHARWREGPAEAHDASAWIAQDPRRVLLVPGSRLAPCFEAMDRRPAGESSREVWWLVEGVPDAACIRQGNPGRAIRYQGPRAPR